MKKQNGFAALAAIILLFVMGCKSELAPVPVQGITLNKTTLTLEPGATAKLTATVTPGDADDRTVTWSVSDTTIATVSADGTVTAVAAGTTTIIAQAGDIMAECRITVGVIRVEAITLDRETLALKPNTTGKLTATITPDNASAHMVTWSTSDNRVAVADNGTIYAYTVGTAIITVRADGKAATCTVTVKETLVEVESVTLNETTLTLTRGKTAKLTATVTPADADNNTAAWSSSDTSVATVDRDDTVTAVNKGTATITAQADGKEATCEVTVSVAVERVALEPASLTLAPGETKNLTATVTPADADDTTVTWSSDNETVATVDKEGTVTAVKKGTATITATTRDGGKTATCAVTVCAHTYSGKTCTVCGNVLYLEDGTIDDNGVLIEYYGNKATVAIPEGVAGIGDGAFKGRIMLTSVSIPDSVKTIGSEVFLGCESLAEVTIPAGVETVDADALKGCADVSVTFAGTKETWEQIVKDVAIADCVMARCADGDDYWYNPQYWEIENYSGFGAFCIIKKYTGAAKTVRLPDYKGGTSIKDRDAFAECSNLECVQIHSNTSSLYLAFDNCETLTRAEFLDGATYIRSRELYECTGLTSVKIGDSVTSIGEDAFSGCTSLASVTIGDGVTSIGYSENIAYGAFSGCSSLEKVTYTGTLAQWCAMDNDSSLMYNAQSVTVEGTDLKSLTALKIPNGVERIGGNAFYRCSLTSVTIPASVTSIGGLAFYECSLTSVTIPASVTSIGEAAFYGREKLADVKYTGTLAQWCAMDNDYCLINNAQSVTVEGKDLKSLAALEIPNGVERIGGNAFYGCSRLTSVAIPDSVTSIGYDAFYGCSYLESVTIGDGVTSIESWAFYDCDSLTSVTIPGSVTNIGEKAFYWCHSLTEVTYDGTKEEWNGITQGYNWDEDTGNYTITCTNGKLDKYGNVIE